MKQPSSTDRNQEHDSVSEVEMRTRVVEIPKKWKAVIVVLVLLQLYSEYSEHEKLDGIISKSEYLGYKVDSMHKDVSDIYYSVQDIESSVKNAESYASDANDEASSLRSEFQNSRCY